MKTQLLTVLAAGLLMSACETATNQDQNVSVGSVAAPGTSGDFKANIKDRVFFNFNKADVSADAKKTLEAQAAWLKTYPATSAKVEGRTDERGTRDYNLALGARRAEAAKSTLAGLGVDAARLTTVSFGKDQPVAPSAKTEEEHAQNRTAVTVIN
ncbi:MAG: OmpA family protein [Alphaproteobacteria bacterium]|nr:OmpA family protein [Alphaproteobacteria bacterium]